MVFVIRWRSYLQWSTVMKNPIFLVICVLVGGIKASLGGSQAAPPPHHPRGGRTPSQGPSPHTWPSHQKPPAPLWWALQFGRDVVMQQEPCQGAVIQTEEEE